MNNFELQEKAEQLVLQHTPLQLARMLIQEMEHTTRLEAKLEDTEYNLKERLKWVAGFGTFVSVAAMMNEINKEFSEE